MDSQMDSQASFTPHDGSPRDGSSVGLPRMANESLSTPSGSLVASLLVTTPDISPSSSSSSRGPPSLSDIVHSDRSATPMKALWFSVDPRSGNVSLYSDAVTACTEMAFSSGRPSASLSGLGGVFEGASIVFSADGNHQQRTATGKRDVRRVEVVADAVALTVYVIKERGWRIADFHAPPVTQERQLDISGVGAAITTAKASSSSSKLCSREDQSGETGTNGSLALWEWCRLAEPPSVETVPSHEWGVYTEEHNRLIEEAFQKGREKISIELGIREYDILFDGRVYHRQVDRQLKKRRHVRRRLVHLDEWTAALRSGMPETIDTADEDCALCCMTFAETPTMPLVQLQRCGHRFHGACAQKLADTNSLCPLCRGEADWKQAFGDMTRK